MGLWYYRSTPWVSQICRHLGLQTVATYSSSAADPPTPIVQRITGTAPEDWIHIERLGSDEFRWCVVWYRLESGLWQRIARVDEVFETPKAALDGVAIALHEPGSAEFLSTSAMAGAGC